MAEPKFQEYTSDELVAALIERSTGDMPVAVELQDAQGNVIAHSVMLLKVSAGSDFDRTGTYQWVKLTARMEP